MHEVGLSYLFDVGSDWRDVQEKKRQQRDAHLLHFHEDLISREPAWSIHGDQDIFHEEQARVMGPEVFRGATTEKCMDTLNSVFGDLDVAVSKLDVLNAQVCFVEILGYILLYFCLC